MGSNPKIEQLIARYAPERREAFFNDPATTEIYTAPVIASYSMNHLGGVAQAQSGNQSRPAAVPIDDGLGLAAAAGAVGVAGAFLLRRRRERKDRDQG